MYIHCIGILLVNENKKNNNGMRAAKYMTEQECYILQIGWNCSIEPCANIVAIQDSPTVISWNRELPSDGKHYRSMEMI